MKKIVLGLLTFVIGNFILSGVGFAQTDYHYFWGVGCTNCLKVDRYFEESHKDVELGVEYHEIRQDPAGLQVLQGFLERLDIPLSSVGTPFLVMEDEDQNLSFLMGTGPIIAHFKSLDGESSSGAVVQSQVEATDLDAEAVHHPLKLLGVMVPMALADSINPCAFAVMLLLLSTIFIKSKSKKKMVLAGLLFSLAIFISYFLMGIGVYEFLGTVETGFWFKWVVGILGVVIGLANIKDYFWYGEGFLMEVPLSWRPTMMKLIQSVISPAGAFMIGIVVSLFLLPCSSGPYFVILGLLRSENIGTSGLGMGYLAIYNLLFILPMLVITFLVGTGKSSIDKIAKLKNKNTKLIHLIVGSLMLVLGLYVISTLYWTF